MGKVDMYAVLIGPYCKHNDALLGSLHYFKKRALDLGGVAEIHKEPSV